MIVPERSVEDADANRRPRKATVTKEDIRTLLSEHGAFLAKNSKTLEDQAAALAGMLAIIHNFQTNGITVQTPDGTITIAQAPAPVVEEPKSPEELAADTYLVRGVFMDFIEIHAALSKSFRDRRPLLASAVQARYSDQAEPSLMIMRKGTFGTNEQMFNTALTLMIHDDEPYIAGDYTDFGRTVNMSDDQVKRCVAAILEGIRAETNLLINPPL